MILKSMTPGMHNHNPMKTMKKNILAPVALLAVLFASCAKEVDTQEAVAVKPDSVKGTPFSLTASVDPTLKTTYESEKTFSWKSGDKIQMMIVSSTDANVVSTAILETSDNAATATFSGTIPEGYVPGEYAFYPYGTGDSSYSSDLQLQPDGTLRLWCTMTPDLDNPLGSVPLIGKVSGSNVAFKTATGILKVTLTGIPSDAYWVCLDMPDNSTYALNGNFTWNDDCILRAENVSGYKWGQKYISFTPAANGETRSFYFAIPVGEIPAGMTLSVATSNHGKIAVKTTVKSINVTANKIINLGTLAVPVWNDLGTGKFIDNFLWAKLVAKGLDKDIPGYVDVTIQQNANNTNQFRLVDPYGAAADQFGYESGNAANRDGYLEFTVDGFTAGSAVTDFTTHRTGFAIDGSNYNPELMYPTTYNSESATAQNMVIAGDASLPKIVQLAPAYHYNGYSLTSSYTYTKAFDKKGIVRIMFPGATGYEGSLTPAASATAATLSPLAWTREANANRIRMIISSYTDYEIAAPHVNDFYCGSYPSGTDAANNASKTDWDASAKVTAANLSSGPVYLTWFTTNSDESIVYSQGRTKVYYISNADVTAYCKQHTSTGFKGSTQNDALSGSYTFAVSENPLTGNIKMTEFDGMTCDVTGMTLDNSHQIYSSLYWIAPSNTTYTGVDPVFTNGTAQYGVLSGSSILLDASDPFFKRGNVNVYVYSYTDFAGSNKGAANTPEHFKFTIANGSINVGEPYINARFDGNNQASAPYSNTVTEVTE